jgi:hypothetical protein
MILQAAAAQDCQRAAGESHRVVSGRQEPAAVRAGEPGGPGHAITFGLLVQVGDPGLREVAMHDRVHGDLLWAVDDVFCWPVLVGRRWPDSAKG